MPCRATLLLAALLLSSPAHATDARIAIPTETTSIDPMFHNIGPNMAFSRNIFDTLIAQDDRQRLQPSLALYFHVNTWATRQGFAYDARFLHTRRSTMTLMTAARTSAQRTAFETVSIVPSINMAWTTHPATIITARTMWARRHVRGRSRGRMKRDRTHPRFTPGAPPAARLGPG